jgi:hypothetical protein
MRDDEEQMLVEAKILANVAERTTLLLIGKAEAAGADPETMLRISEAHALLRRALSTLSAAPEG